MYWVLLINFAFARKRIDKLHKLKFLKNEHRNNMGEKKYISIIKLLRSLATPTYHYFYH